LYNKTTDEYQNLGNVDEGRFLFDDVKEPPIILYKHGNM
jgi:hypothetical protein